MSGKVLNDGVSGVLGARPQPAESVEPVEEVERFEPSQAEAEFFLASAGAEDETEEVESP